MSQTNPLPGVGGVAGGVGGKIKLPLLPSSSMGGSQTESFSKIVSAKARKKERNYILTGNRRAIGRSLFVDSPQLPPLPLSSTCAPTLSRHNSAFYILYISKLLYLKLRETASPTTYLYDVDRNHVGRYDFCPRNAFSIYYL